VIQQRRTPQAAREKQLGYHLATARDEDTCIFRAWDCAGATNRDHRQGRDAFNTVASNLQVLCVKHHAWKHANTDEAVALGHTVPMNVRPDMYPVRRWRRVGVVWKSGWVLFDDEGGITWISEREAAERLALEYPGMRWSDVKAAS